jgi:DNA polymerase-3 subunit epsilon
VDNSHRELHGALLDAQILLDVYLAMTGGQTALILDEVRQEQISVVVEREVAMRPVGELLIILASDDELAAHERLLAAVDKASGKKTLWRALDLPPPALAANMN